MAKKIISLILCIVIALCSVPMVTAKDIDAKLYNVYADGMLFAQNKDAILSGIADVGASIKAELFNSENTLITSAEASADASGEFEISFKAPAGSYEEYTIVLTADGVEFDKLENIVFGELWLASGQSNMEYSLASTPTGTQMKAENKKLSKWLRVLLVPTYPEYNGVSAPESVPLVPQKNIIDSKWVNGEDADVYKMSAVAYFFAEELMKKLDMPIGVLSSTLGGSTIISWISRDEIENDEKVKSILEAHGSYYSEEIWYDMYHSLYHDMTANYNARTYALRNFRPTGLIWYQGETDLMFGYSPEEYATQFELLQKSYSRLFDFEDELMPVIYTQLASYMYSKNGGFELPEWNIGYTEMQKAYPDSRAMITLSDVSLSCRPAQGFIHPETKEPVGQRMAYAAGGLVYGDDYSYTAPSVESYEIKGSEAYIKFTNVGDGLKANGKEIIGFAVCGADGIYISAEAEIISKDTVKVYSPCITKPVSVTYAYSVKNDRSNLWGSDDGKLTFPVSTFITNKVDTPHYWVDRTWVDCEVAEDILNYHDQHSAVRPIWQGFNCNLDYNAMSAYKGTNGLDITSDKKSFYVKNVISYIDDAETRRLYEADDNYSDYNTMSFAVKNNSSSPVTLESVRFYGEVVIWYEAEIQSTNSTEFVIPADNEWHIITVDLNSLYLMGAENSLIYSNNMLNNLKEIRFVFSAENGADISIDEFNFTAEETDTKLQYNSEFSLLGSIAKFLKEFWPTFAEWVVKVIKYSV